MNDGTVTLYVATSLDGFVATEDGGVAWLDAFEEATDDGAVARDFDAFLASVGCLVLGSETYEQVLSFGEWPYGETPAYVATGRDLPLATDAVELYDGPLDELVRRLRRRYDHVWLVGGARLAQSFLRADHIDEIRVTVAPRLLGAGISLFGDAGAPRDLRVLSTTSYPSGLVELRYSVERDGVA